MKKWIMNYDKYYIKKVLSLRRPQAKSLDILEDLINNSLLDASIPMSQKEEIISNIYPSYKESERDFLSITFALATGVGKTRLMGAIIAYLFTQHNIKNFFVVAPNTTIFKKLKSDLGDPSSSKYVFNGLGCFTDVPQLVTDDDYKTKQASLYDSEIKIYVYNIDKFNSENTKMRSETNEIVGGSFIKKISNLKDLILIMDESHHYRAEKSAQALNDLKPLLGIELTATPIVKKQYFKNVVYEYPLSQAITDGYTRTPYAITRSDIDYSNLSPWEIDKHMLHDGILCHENTKIQLKSYTENNNLPYLKPFVMVVCKNTDHALDVYKYVTSNEFFKSKYSNKTLIIHSKQKKLDKEENLRLLLNVEKPYNPIEIVIHVDMLKEGWDVNNLYTIIPLRAANSQILREQMVGRGLRLPFGKRVDCKEIDAVMLTAHDKFDEILKEAQKGDSIFKAGNVIDAKNIKKEKIVISKPNNSLNIQELTNNLRKKLKIEKNDRNKSVDSLDIISMVIKNMVDKGEYNQSRKIDLTDTFNELENESLMKDIGNLTNQDKKEINNFYNINKDEFLKDKSVSCISIPQLRQEIEGKVTIKFPTFQINTDNFRYNPIEKKLKIQNLIHQKDTEDIVISDDNLEDINLRKILIYHLRTEPELDYGKNKELIHKLVEDVLEYFSNSYSEQEVVNIVSFNQKAIANEIFKQLIDSRIEDTSSLSINERVESISHINHLSRYTYESVNSLFENYNDKNIRNILFNDLEKCVFQFTKFDSNPELLFARILENDEKVEKWLRPHINDFNLEYYKGKRYQPDFVVETEEQYIIVEIKGEDKLNDPMVISKSKRALEYCKIVNTQTNSKKKWHYILIPASEVKSNISINNYLNKYQIDY